MWQQAGIIAGKSLFQVSARMSKLSLKERDKPQLIVGFCEKQRVVYLLGQAEELLPQLTRGLYLRPHGIIGPQAAEYRGELRSFFHQPT
jgi:hypothetical protein